MKELLIKILNTPITKAILKDLKKWLISKLIDCLQEIITKLADCEQRLKVG